MHVLLDGCDVPLSRLWVLYATVRLPARAAGPLDIRYTLPHRSVAGVLVLAAFVASTAVGRRMSVFHSQSA